VIVPPAASRSAAPKPTVLLVDDHRDVLKSVSRVVAHDFDVVGLATDGREALDAVHKLDPDLVVLDITLPGLDGFQTAREFARRGSRARVLFLSMHETEEFVTEGFRSGGRGYVLKRRVHQDLVRAIQSVVAGQLFAPTLKSLYQLTTDEGRHTVQFYDDDEMLIDGLSRFLAMALRCGDAVSVVMREHIRAGVADILDAQGWRVSDGGAHGRYQAFDAADALSSIMRGGVPDADLLAKVVDGMERTRLSVVEGPARRHTIVGEMSTPLFVKGDAEAGMEVERLWSQVTRSLPFLTLCCHPAPHFEAQPAELFSELCGEHWAVA
jgi:DNA-binding response OmpR family regulator